MKPLTDAQHHALGRSRSKSGVPVSGPREQPDGKRAITDGHVSHQTANVLILAGFALLEEGKLHATQAGWREFNSVRPEGPGTYLDRNPARPLTHSLAHAAGDEPEVMDVALLHPDWRNHAEAHRKLSREDLDAARLSGLDHPEERLRELRLMAAEKGVDVKDELRYVAHSLRILERKVRREAA